MRVLSFDRFDRIDADGQGRSTQGVSSQLGSPIYSGAGALPFLAEHSAVSLVGPCKLVSVHRTRWMLYDGPFDG